MGTRRDEVIKNNMLALIVEATEVLNEVHWKPWHSCIKEINIDNLKEEIVDCLLFVFNAAHEANIKPNELALLVCQKQDKNMKRF